MSIQYPMGGGPQPINTSPYNAGSRSPRPPNNGNPRGASNMPPNNESRPLTRPPAPRIDPTMRQRPPMPVKYPYGAMDQYDPNEVQPDGQVTKPGNSFVSTNPLMGGQPPMPAKNPQPMPGGRNGSGNFQELLQQMMERFRNQGQGGGGMGGGQGLDNGYGQGGQFQPQGMRPQQPQYPPRGDGNYYAQQSPDRGRYVPPMMNRDGQGWQNQGGYNYNLPNAFGNYPSYGQGDPNSQYFGYGYSGMYGGG